MSSPLAFGPWPWASPSVLRQNRDDLKTLRLADRRHLIAADLDQPGRIPAERDLRHGAAAAAEPAAARSAGRGARWRRTDPARTSPARTRRTCGLAGGRRRRDRLAHRA